MTRGPGWPRDGAGERGAALLAVLWFVAAVSALAIGFSRFATADRVIIVTQVEAVQARALAQEGLMRAILAVNQRDADRPLPRSLTWTLAEAQITARLESEAGKIDLNAADRTLLTGLARAVGLPTAKAEAIGDAIVDWRDEDEARQPNGAETKEYDGAEREHGPANKPFRQIEELRYVLPVDNAAYALMAPHLTLYTGQAQPERRLASRTVRTAFDIMRGLKPRQEQEGVEQRRRGSLGSDDAATPDGPSGTPQPETQAEGEGDEAQAAGGGGPPVYTVRLDVRLAGGYESHARAVVALAGEEGAGDRVLRVLDWAAALPAPPPPAAAGP